MTAAVRCEAGWTAHLAGDDDAAAIEIDAALAELDAGPHLPSLVEDLARCLEHRADVFAVRGAPDDATGARDAAARLRAGLQLEGAVVDRLLVGSMSGEDVPSGPPVLVGGVGYGTDGLDCTLDAATDAELERAMASGWRRAALVGRASVTRGAALALPSPVATRAVVYSVHGEGVGDGAFVVFSTDHGYRLHALPPDMSDGATLTVADGTLRVEATSSRPRVCFFDGVSAPDTVCWADCPFEVTTVVRCSIGATPRCRPAETSGRPLDAAHVRYRCHSTADGSLVEAAPSAAPVGVAFTETLQPIEATLCPDHAWCGDFASWRHGPEAEPSAAESWIPGTVSFHSAQFVREVTNASSAFVAGMSPPLLGSRWRDTWEYYPGYGTWGTCDDCERPQWDHIAYSAPHRGGWRTLVTVQARSGEETVTAGSPERVDLVPGDPLELRIPLHRRGGDVESESLVVCALVDGALACRQSEPEDSFDGEGHVVHVDGGRSTQADLGEWIRAAPMVHAHPLDE